MTTYHDPIVLPAAKVIPDPGDTITRFNRYYLCINPDPSKGPPTWRVSDPDEYPCSDGEIFPPGTTFAVEAYAPLVVSGDNTAIEYSFSMDGVPMIDTAGSADVTDVPQLLQPVFLNNLTFNPVKSVYNNSEKTTETRFDIYGLTYVEFARTSKRQMKVTVYNSNRSIPVASTDPVQSSQNTASTDLFFNISSLPHAS